MKRILALLLLAIIAPHAFAKCGTKNYVLRGSVVDADGAPVADALVGASWMRLSRPDGPTLALTDDHGRYSIPILFDTWVGMDGTEDLCDGSLNQVSLSAATRNSRSMPELVSFGNESEVAAPVMKIEYPLVTDVR